MVSILLLCDLSLFGEDASEFFNLQWKNSDAEIHEAHIGESITIQFETENMPDDEILSIEIWGKTENGAVDIIDSLQGIVKNNIVAIDWVVKLDLDNADAHYAHEIKNNGYTIIDYFFVIKHDEIFNSSEPLEIFDLFCHLFVNKTTREPLRNMDFVLRGPEIIPGTTNDEGYGIIKLRKIGEYSVIF